MNPLLLDINEVAAALGVGRRTAYTLRARSDFPRPIMLAARCVRYRASDVQVFVERLASDPPASEPERLKVGKARRRGSTGGLAGGPSGGTAMPTAAKPRQSRGTAERLSVEPKTGADSNPRKAA